MTNKIEISREQLERLADFLEDHVFGSAIEVELRALLTAPAVERQEPDELDALWADAHYLCARIADGSLNAKAVAERIRRNIEGCRNSIAKSPPAPVAVVHFVCDRIPDQTGCTFIECEDATGSSIDAGKWEVRPDGLAQLVVSRAPINLPEYKRPPPGCVITQEMAAHNACLNKVREMNQCS